MKRQFLINLRLLLLTTLLLVNLTACDRNPTNPLGNTSPITLTPTAVALPATTSDSIPIQHTQPPLPTGPNDSLKLSGKLAFTFGRGDSYQIAVLNLREGVVQELTSLTAPGDSEPVWFPDGQRIAFISGRTRKYDFEIYSMKSDGSDVKLLITTSQGSGGNYSPAISPDSKHIAFHTNSSGNMEIYVANIDGSNPVNITNQSSNEASPNWSPNGKTIVFASDRSGEYQLYTMNSDGTNVQHLLNHPGNFDFRPHYSPDGKHIVFGTQVGDPRVGSSEGYHVGVINSDGSNLHILTKGTDKNSQAAWCGNDTIIFSQSIEGASSGRWHLTAISSDGLHQQTILSYPDADLRNPACIQ